MKKTRDGKLLIPDIKALRSLCKLLGKFKIIYYQKSESLYWNPDTQTYKGIWETTYGIGLSEAKNFMEGIYTYEGPMF